MKHQDGLGKVAQITMAFLTDQNFGAIRPSARLFSSACIAFLPHKSVSIP
jgi:hypothetical protein